MAVLIKKYKFWILLHLIIFTSCGSDEEQNPPMGDGEIIGNVVLFNEFNVPRPNEGMEVSILDSDEKTITDARGNFTLSNIPFNNYQLVFNKPGYGSFVSEEFDHSGANGDTTFLPKSYFLGQLSNTSIISARATLDNNDFLITIETEPSASTQDPLFITVFLNGNASVSNETNSAVHGTLRIEKNPVEIRIEQQQLYDYGFSADKTVFFKVYGDSFFNNSYNKLGSVIHPNVNPISSPTFDLVVQ